MSSIKYRNAAPAKQTPGVSATALTHKQMDDNFWAIDVTEGTVAANKAIVVDANKDFSGVRNATITGAITGLTTPLTAAQGGTGATENVIANFSCSTSDSILTSTTEYIGASGWAQTFGTEAAQQSVICPVSGTVKNMYVTADTNASTAGNCIVMIRKAPSGTKVFADTAVLATITPGSTASFNSGATSFSITAGDLLKIQVANSGDGSISGLQVAFQVVSA